MNIIRIHARETFIVRRWVGFFAFESDAERIQPGRQKDRRTDTERKKDRKTDRTKDRISTTKEKGGEKKSLRHIKPRLSNYQASGEAWQSLKSQ